MSIRMNPKLENILKYFTPLKDFYQDPFNYNEEIIDSIREWFPHINGLIKSEQEYLNFRLENTPKESELLDELFIHLPDKVVFQPENELVMYQILSENIQNSKMVICSPTSGKVKPTIVK